MKKMNKKDVAKMLFALTVTAVFLLFLFGWLPLDKDSDEGLEYTTIAESESWQLEVRTLDTGSDSRLSYKGFGPDIEKTIKVVGYIVDVNDKVTFDKNIDRYSVWGEMFDYYWPISDFTAVKKADLTIQWSDGEQTYEEKLSNVEI